MISNNKAYTLSRKSKGLSGENIKPSSTTNKIHNALLDFAGTKTRVKFKGSCLKQEQILFDYGKIVNIYMVYEMNRKFEIDSYPALKNFLFGTVKLPKHPDIDKYKYSGYGIGFDRKIFFYLAMKLVEM